MPRKRAAKKPAELKKTPNKKAKKEEPQSENESDSEIKQPVPRKRAAKKPAEPKKTPNKKAKKEEPQSENESDSEIEQPVEETSTKTIYDFTVNDIEGNAIKLDKYKGKVCLIVNVASRCGYTSKNYKELVELDEKYQGKDFDILAFPCNQFGKQEPGTNEKICEYVRNKKNGKFDLFEKIEVNGAKADPLFKFLCDKLNDGNPIKWNFCKFIVNKQGEPVEYHLSKINPLGLVPNIDKLLKK